MTEKPSNELEVNVVLVIMFFWFGITALIFGAIFIFMNVWVGVALLMTGTISSVVGFFLYHDLKNRAAQRKNN